jgi:N6-L-threonylcarbamoyladenine synthase
MGLKRCNQSKMKILSIETSCDETAVSLIKAKGDFPHATYEILGNSLFSQIDIHKEYGGVFPAVAKREHAKTLVPMLEKALGEADELEEATEPPSLHTLKEILEREPGLFEQLSAFATKYQKPDIDLIAVTAGPGLEPTLWVGVNFAKALAILWDVPCLGVNHMEGHVLASVFDAERDDMLADISFPAIALLISGGHTELILMKDWNQYEKIGQTRDDAVGEAFDKVARLLGISYPGGPEVSKKAAEARKLKLPSFADLPRPMINSGDLDFSFSGLKTAVLYAVKGKDLTDKDRLAICRDFEDATAAVLVKKVEQALSIHGAKTLIVGGGVAGNQYIKRQIETALLKEFPDVTTYFPAPGLSTDNSIMIALAGHANHDQKLTPKGAATIVANGNRSLSDEGVS